jgi:hypothetical protein
MALTYKSRKRLAILVLLVGLPVYITLALNLVAQFDRPSVLVEVGIYLGLGLVWILPLKSLFKGVGQPDPDAAPDDIAE